MQTFEELLAASVAAHGHLCAGQVVGVRMALLGLRLLNFETPPSLTELKRLLVYVEMDPCAGGAYFSGPREIFLPGLNWSPCASFEDPPLQHVVLNNQATKRD
jgi:FmdE, Molybdenum formylmethanofuran dehydrogenase operon